MIGYIKNKIAKKIQKRRDYKRLQSYQLVDIGYNWADSFKDAALQDGFYEKIQNLKKGLDTDSKNLIDEILEKLVCLIPRATQKALIAKKSLFTQRDLELQHRILREKAWEEYPLSTYFMSEVYYFHNGIKFLSQHIIEKYIQGNVVVDMGAANGDSAFVFSLYKPALILSFESGRENFMQLEQNIKTYNLPVHAMNYAIANHDDNTHKKLDSIIQANMGGGGANSLAKPIGLIKMDIEGGEINALLGAKRSIQEYKPILIISIYHNVEQFFGVKELLETWNLDYTFRIIKLSVFHPTDEIMLLAYHT